MGSKVAGRRLGGNADRSHQLRSLMTPSDNHVSQRPRVAAAFLWLAACVEVAGAHGHVTVLKVVPLHTDGAREDGLHSHMLSLSPLSCPGYPCPRCDSLSFVAVANIRFSL